jgi:hypothetical protein
MVEKVLILVERVSRERDLAEFLTLKNNSESKYYVEIKSIPYDLYTISFITYDLILIPFVPSSPSPFATLIKELLLANKRVVSLNWEQYLPPVSASYRGNAFKKFNSTGLLMCSWSEKFSDFLLELGFCNEKIVKVQNYNSMILKLRILLDRGSIKTEKIIFFPMNYAWAFADGRFIKYRVKTGYSELLANEYVEYSKKCLASFVHNLEIFSRMNADYKIVVKAYPGISQKQCEKFLELIEVDFPKNVKFLYNVDASDYLLRSCIVISSWSTAALDRFLIDGRSVLFTPLERPEWLDVHWNSDLLNLNTLECTVSEIKEKLVGYNSDRISHYEQDLNFDDFFKRGHTNCNYSISSFVRLKALQFRFFTYNKKNRIIFWLNKHGVNKATGFENDRFTWDRSSLKIKKI